MQSSSSRFISNIVPLQNVQTNVSGQGPAQTLAALQSTVAALQSTVAALQARVAVLEGKVG